MNNHYEIRVIAPSGESTTSVVAAFHAELTELLPDICGNCGGTFQLEQMAAFIPPCWYCKTCTEKLDTCSFCNQSFPNDNADTPPTDRYWADSEHTCCKKCLRLESLALCKICKQPKLIENMAFGICQECLSEPIKTTYRNVVSWPLDPND